MIEIFVLFGMVFGVAAARKYLLVKRSDPIYIVRQANIEGEPLARALKKTSGGSTPKQ